MSLPGRVDVSQIATDLDLVAELLGNAFNLSANGGDSELNTTLFAVALGNSDGSGVGGMLGETSTKSAVYAHTQSSAGDDTIDAVELTLLAEVNTNGGVTGVANFSFELDDGTFDFTTLKGADSEIG